MDALVSTIRDLSMLEFIVLGQVPGTNIYLPFDWVIGAIAIISMAGLSLALYKSLIRPRKNVQSLIEQSL